MRQQLFKLLISAMLLAAAGCGRGEHATTSVEKHLTVTGPQQGVHSFATLQGSLKPALVTTPIKYLGRGRAETTVTLPPSYDGKDLIHMTREALAADLSYEYVERRLVKTIRWRD